MTLEPATIATSGRFGCASALGDRVDLGREQRAGAGDLARTARCRRSRPRRGARCRRRRATKMSHSAAILRASASSFFFSPLLRRQFSSITTWPGATATPSTQFATSGTSRPSSSARRAATGASESSGLNSPSVGRPRCEVTITAAPASSAMRDAGHAGADAGVFGDVAGVVLRHVQVGADEDALAGHLAGGDEVGEAEDVHSGAVGSRILRLRRSTGTFTPNRTVPRFTRCPAARSCAAASGDRAMPSSRSLLSPLAGMPAPSSAPPA